MSYLVVTRHGKTQWNIEGKWTGWTDIPLGPEGVEEAKKAGETIKDIKFDIAFVSALQRARQTLEAIRSVLANKDFPVISSPALNERDYGDLTAKNKWKIKEEYGEEQFLKWRRGWADEVPNGESLKKVYERVVPYYESEILPRIEKGENVLVSIHGNSMRALVKYLENIPDAEIPNLEIATGAVYVYKLDNSGKVISKEIRGNRVNTV